MTRCDPKIKKKKTTNSVGAQGLVERLWKLPSKHQQRFRIPSPLSLHVVLSTILRTLISVTPSDTSNFQPYNKQVCLSITMKGKHHLIYLLTGLGAILSNAQSLLLALYSGITPACSRYHMDFQSSNSSRPCSRPYLLYYCSASIHFSKKEKEKNIQVHLTRKHEPQQKTKLNLWGASPGMHTIPSYYKQ